MRATLLYGAGKVRIENVPDATIKNPTDALVRIARACICGSDLWPYNLREESETGQRMGHEAIGVVEAVGSEVVKIKKGDVVVIPFAYSDGTCEFCEEGLHTSCLHGGWFGQDDVGCQAEALRVPMADGTLFPLGVSEDDALMASLLTLSDVMGTGHHAARSARAGKGRTVAIIGDGAVGLCGCIAAKRFGAEEIIMLGRHDDRIALAREFGATEIVSERGDEAIERVRELTKGRGVHSVLECVGTDQSMATAMGIARPGASIGRVGVPHYAATPGADRAFGSNISVCGGVAPVRAYIKELLPDIMEGRIQPGKVFDSVMGIEDIPSGYQAMNERKSIKVMIKP